MRTLRYGLAAMCALLVAFAGGPRPQHAFASDRGKSKVNHLVSARIAPPAIGLFIARANGAGERPLLPSTGRDYNPSFSADGKWIVFTSERAGAANIFRVHPDGSGLQQLTHGPAFSDQASLSPNGRTLAFVSTRDSGTASIWLLDLRTNRYRRLTSGPSGSFRPSWSPDGRWVAFSSDRGTRKTRWYGGWELLQSTSVYIVHPDGGALRRMTAPGSVAGSPQWSPDGARIVCYESSLGDVYPGRVADVIGVPDDRTGDAIAQIVQIDARTGDSTPLTKGPGLKLSPHYVGRDVGYILQSRQQRRLAFVSGRAAASGTDLAQPSWSPDGKSMVYQKTIPVRPPALTPTFSADPGFTLSIVSGVFPAFSPSGRTLVVSRFAPDATGRVSAASGKAIVGQLWAMDADGSHPRVLFSKPGMMAFAPEWSPDGRSIVFSLGDYLQVGMGTFNGGRPSPSQLAEIDADGSHFRLLTHSPDVNSGFASWSPDGRHLVYRIDGSSGNNSGNGSNSSGSRGLRILDLTDGTSKTLTTADDNFPGWSPRGDRIEFTRNADGRFSIYSIRPDGTGLRRLTDTDGNDAHGTWSPDGHSIVFSSSRRGWKDEAMLGGTTFEDPSGSGPQPYGELFAIHPDGSDVRQLTDNQWEDATAAWMPHTAATERPPSGEVAEPVH